MAKRSALTRAVANFNRRISREIARNPSAASYLPEPLRARDIRAGIATGRERDRVVKELNRFRAPQMQRVKQGREQGGGLPVTAWELNRAKRYNERANAARIRELAVREAAPVNFRSRIGEVEKTRLQPRTIDLARFPDTEKGREAWRLFVQAEQRIGQEKYFENKADAYKREYLKRVQALAGKNTPEARKLVAQVKAIPAEKLYLSQWNDPLLNFSMIASPKTDTEDLASQVGAHWADVDSLDV